MLTFYSFYLMALVHAFKSHFQRTRNSLQR